MSSLRHGAPDRLVQNTPEGKFNSTAHTSDSWVAIDLGPRRLLSCEAYCLRHATPPLALVPPLPPFASVCTAPVSLHCLYLALTVSGSHCLRFSLSLALALTVSGSHCVCLSHSLPLTASHWLSLPLTGSHCLSLALTSSHWLPLALTSSHWLSLPPTSSHWPYEGTEGSRTSVG